MQTINEVAQKIQSSNPNIQLYWNIHRNAIGYWSKELGRVQVLVGKLLDGHWGTLPEILIDGEPMIPAKDWELIPCE